MLQNNLEKNKQYQQRARLQVFTSQSSSIRERVKVIADDHACRKIDVHVRNAVVVVVVVVVPVR